MACARVSSKDWAGAAFVEFLTLPAYERIDGPFRLHPEPACCAGSSPVDPLSGPGGRTKPRATRGSCFALPARDIAAWLGGRDAGAKVATRPVADVRARPAVEQPALKEWASC
jgi:hypothetical protein